MNIARHVPGIPHCSSILRYRRFKLDSYYLVHLAAGAVGHEERYTIVTLGSPLGSAVIPGSRIDRRKDGGC
jgi:hypothetical protein